MSKSIRPRKLTPELQKKICDAIRLGNFRDIAAEYVGVSERTMRYWTARGRDDEDGAYVDFLRAVVQAEREAEVKMVNIVTLAATEDARHAHWWLERKCHERWGRKDRIAVTGKDDGPIQTNVTVTHADLTKLTDDELAALESIAARLTGPAEDPT